MELVTSARPWPAVDRPRRAAVSSFGISGTNAHVILEAPEAGPASDLADPTGSAPVTPWLLSARSAEALAEQAARLAGHLHDHHDVSPAEVGWSLVTTRAGLEHRAAVIGVDRDALLTGLSAVAQGESA
ncbi:ketoacyl-synthetase C-terminal extension domain-containing protein, partial [Micromonospora sp. NBS 11-29]|uniref:ketoacyl-synthetase C-terminal extension domain-containing protein n=1 Tax=Micromonospora sp. NBS 11-29 TaxID=1960879 RepID=UPI0020CDB5CF